MDKIYDMIIIGSGAAGLTAAIYARRAQLDFIVIEKMGLSGGQILNTYEVDNYPGLWGIGGFELGTKFREHADRLGAEFVIGEVSKLSIEDNIKIIKMDNEMVYKSRTVVIATGASNSKLNIEGEEEFLGMGVSYCATCDGAFFKDKDVVVIGGGDVAVEDAIYLARICRKVYVIHRRDEFRATKVLSNKLLSLDNVEVLWDSVAERITGSNSVDSVSVKNVKDNSSFELAVSGVFIAVGTIPNSNTFKGVVGMNEKGYIIAEENCETDVLGILAAGDVRSKQLKQVITAAADGANAVMSAERYLLQL